jgi:uncharacterized protein YndB with AHSA1/START domain
MKNNPSLQFSIDKENKKIKVTKEFSAPLKEVWTAWTDPAILDQWWAPKPYQAKTKAMDFREGGSWLYAMTAPDGTAHWSKADYKSIHPMKSFSGLDAFCDENGNINTDLPRSLWNVTFIEKGSSTVVTIDVAYNSVADLEKNIEMGFKEGFTMTLESLEDMFVAQTTLK